MVMSLPHIPKADTRSNVEKAKMPPTPICALFGHLPLVLPGEAVPRRTMLSRKRIAD
jgi:hypothetical protein